MSEVRFASASSRAPAFRAALGELVSRVATDLGGRAPDCAFLFVSPHHAEASLEAPSILREQLGVRHLIGCTGAGVCETAGELEQGPAIALLAGAMPDTRIVSFVLGHDQLVRLGEPGALAAELGIERSEDPSFVLLADPFSVDPDLLLGRLDDAYPGAPCVGGLASGGMRPGKHVLFTVDGPLRAGAVGLALTGSSLRPVVSQGCRPVGRRFVVTKCQGNKVFTLSGRPALDAIQDTLRDLPEADRVQARANLLIGRAIRETQDDFTRGDFVIRNFVGVVPQDGAVVIGDRIRVGQTVQLQLRDRAAATEDMAELLATAGRGGPAPHAALLFSCGGRGERLFGESGHDVRKVTERFGDLPIAGFFCAGEIGSVGGRNFLHGFTASVGLL